MFFGRRLAAALCLILLARLEAADSNLMPGADSKWRHYQSEHFELFSRNPEGESRRLLHNLELVRAVFFETYGFKPVRALPMTVYFFSRDRHFETYKPEKFKQLEELGTFYHPEPDRGILTVAPLPTYEAAQQLAFAGYTHHLFRVMDEVPPVWYRYGVSGLSKNMEIGSKTVTIGRPDENQVRRLQQAKLIPVEVMFAADQESRSFQSDEGNRLYQDQSWALLHYLHFGSHKLPREGVSEFVKFTLRNSRRFDAEQTRAKFESLLGTTYDQLEVSLERYLRTGRYGYNERPLPDVPSEKTYTMRIVSLPEINLRLAELAMRVNRSPLGKLTLLHAAEQPAEAARIQEALGSDAVKEGDWDQAAERWERALAAGSSNPAIMHELVLHEGRKRFSRFDLYYRLPDEAAAKLRDLLEKSIAAAPGQTDAYEILAWVEATANDPRIQSINLVQKQFSRLKEQHRTLLALAVVRMRLGDKTGAAGLLDALDKSTNDDWIKNAAEHTRAMLESRPVDHSRLSGLKMRSSSSVVPMPIRMMTPPK